MSRIKKMPLVTKAKGKLTPHGVEDRKATRVGPEGNHKGFPHKTKTPSAQMPNNSIFHKKAVVKEGHHAATSGGTGKATKRVAQEQANTMFMRGQVKKRKNTAREKN